MGSLRPLIRCRQDKENEEERDNKEKDKAPERGNENTL